MLYRVEAHVGKSMGLDSTVSGTKGLPHPSLCFDSLKYETLPSLDV